MLLCFLLDLRNLSSSLFHDLKQSLLQLANLYAASTVGIERVWRTEETSMLPGRIGLCYIQGDNSSSSSSSEVKIAYKPGGCFSLQDFHHAVNNLPMSLPTESSEHTPTRSDNDVELSIRRILSNEFLYIWNAEDIPKKMIVTTTYVFTSSEPLQKILIDSATKLAVIELVVLEEVMSQMARRLIYNLDQLQICVIHRQVTDAWILSGLVRRWLQDIRNKVEELEAILIFKHAIFTSSNQIFCTLFASTEMIVDGFTSCQKCRCHERPIGYASSNAKKKVCPVTFCELGESDLIDNVVRVGGNTALIIPSVDSSYELQKISGPITFNVIERTKLASLCEGVIMGTSFIVIPTCHEKNIASNYHDKLELNAEILLGLGESLHTLDHGLVCSSMCNLETMTSGKFMNFYILQPSCNGPMLLRRLAGSEEILPIPNHLDGPFVSERIKNSIQASLSKVELRDYNPLQHERGLHPYLNFLVKESMQSGSLSTAAEMTPKLADTAPKPAVIILSEEEIDDCPNQKHEDNMNSSITDDWEKLLIVDDMNESFSASCDSGQKTRNLTQFHDKPLDERTCRILERLEAPKISSSISPKVVSREKKKPSTLLVPTASQLLRPNFQRPKRKFG